MKSFGPPSPRISSRGIPTLRGPLLTDKLIERYIRKGHYGSAARQRQLEWDEYKKKDKRKPRPKVSAIDALNQLLYAKK